MPFSPSGELLSAAVEKNWAVLRRPVRLSSPPNTDAIGPQRRQLPPLFSSSQRTELPSHACRSRSDRDLLRLRSCRWASDAASRGPSLTGAVGKRRAADNLSSPASHADPMTTAGSPGPTVVGARYQEPSAPPTACWDVRPLPAPNAAVCQAAFPLRPRARLSRELFRRTPWQVSRRRAMANLAAWLWHPTSCRLCTALTSPCLAGRWTGFLRWREPCAAGNGRGGSRAAGRGLARGCPLADPRS